MESANYHAYNVPPISPCHSLCKSVLYEFLGLYLPLFCRTPNKWLKIGINRPSKWRKFKILCYDAQ